MRWLLMADLAQNNPLSQKSILTLASVSLQLVLSISDIHMKTVHH